MVGFNLIILVVLSGQQEEESHRSRGVAATAHQVTEPGGGVTSYLVATSPEVLSQLLRENESRGLDFNPALYTTPANALNTAKVDFAPVGHPPPPSPYTSRHRTRQTSGSLERSASTTSSLSRGLRRKQSFGTTGTGTGNSYNSNSQVTPTACFSLSLLHFLLSLAISSLHFTIIFLFTPGDLSSCMIE